MPIPLTYNPQECENDPHNNVGRCCDVIGVVAQKDRAWTVMKFVRDVGGNSTYWLRNFETDEVMRCGLSNMTNLY
jgi:hypothetical protein